MKDKIDKYIKIWQDRCYPELPDESPIEIFDKVPSYQKICMAIMKNDHLCKTLGFSLTKGEMELRNDATGKYENLKERINGQKYSK